MNDKKRWKYVIAGVAALFFAGVIYAWSIISRSFQATFPDWSTAQLSLNFTITMAMFCGGCLVTGVLERRLTAGVRLRLAAILVLAGFLLTSGVQNLPMLYLGFGVLSGLGSGIAYNTVISTVTAWFPDKKGLVSGILLMGFGFSSFLIGKCYTAITHLDASDTWRWTFRGFAVLVFAIFLVLSFCIKRPEMPDQAVRRTKEMEKYDSISGSAGEMEQRDCVLESPGEMQEYEGFRTKEMIRCMPFWCYYIWAVLFSAVGLVLVSQASIMASDIGVGMTPGTIATVVGLISVLNGAGRICFGSLYDKKGYRFTMLADMILFLAADMILLAAIRGESFAVLTVGFVAGGFAYGGVTPMNAAVIDEFFGRRQYAMNFSVVSTNLLLASFASTVAGSLYDRSGSYMSTVVMMLLFTVAGAAAFAGVRKPRKRKQEENQIKKGNKESVRGL